MVTLTRVYKHRMSHRWVLWMDGGSCWVSLLLLYNLSRISGKFCSVTMSTRSFEWHHQRRRRYDLVSFNRKFSSSFSRTRTNPREGRSTYEIVQKRNQSSLSYSGKNDYLTPKKANRMHRIQTLNQGLPPLITLCVMIEIVLSLETDGFGSAWSYLVINQRRMSAYRNAYWLNHCLFL